MYSSTAVLYGARVRLRDDMSVQATRAPYTSAVAAFVFCGVIPLYLVVQTPDPKDDAWALALVVAVGSGFGLARLIHLGEARLYELVTWLFIYAFLGLAPVVQFRTGDAPATTPYVDTSLNRAAMVVVIAGSLAIVVGMWLADRWHPVLRGAGSQRAPVLGRTTLLSVVSLVLAAYYVSSIGLTTLFSSRAERSRVSEIVWGDATTALLVYSVTSMTLLVATVAAFWRWRARRGEPWDTGTLLAVVTGVTLLLTVNPVSSPRYVVGTVYLALAAALGAFDTARRFRTVVVAAVAGLLLVFPIADAFRYSADSSVTTASPVESLQTADFDVIRQVNNTLQYVEELGATDGGQALGVALFWVPRAMWPEKPVDTGIFLAKFMGYRVTNLSAPLWAELFINGGWPLLLVGMTVFGWCVRRWDRVIVSWRNATTPAAVILPFYLLFILRGSLLQAMANVVIIMAVSALVTGRVSSSTRGSRELQQAPH